MGTTKVRSVKHPDERRSELIDCAQKLFYSKGYENTSVRDIVDELGVAKGTFYYYFDSKQAILEATVQQAINESLLVLRAIVDDESLDAPTKWVRAMQGVGSWKAGRKEELLGLLRILQSDDNIQLLFQIRSRTPRALAPELARIIEQGVREGAFDTGTPLETAEIALAIMTAVSDAFTGLVLQPESYEDPIGEARRLLSAVQEGVERVLGAQPGSLPLISDDVFALWFE